MPSYSDHYDEPARRGYLEKAIESVHGNVIGLEEIVSRLTDRLGPVLSPEMETRAVVGTMSEDSFSREQHLDKIRPESPAVTTIGDLDKSILRAITKLNAIIDRLDT